MAYEVTATRRRPQKFDDLVGQEFVASTLKNSIKNKQIAHAYLFSGPRGCGKTSTARILAKVLNCMEESDKVPCGVCPACKEISNGTSMDVIEIDGASNTSVNDIRQIKDEVLFPPNSYKYKIYIIDEVHMLSTSAFNALLKTIEEPPPYVIFIFATTELHKVPATIKSRCQQFHFRLGSVEQIKELLAKTAEEAGLKADDEALYWIARESTGSFRDAYTLFDQVAAFSGDTITYDGIRDKLGLVGTERLNELCELCCVGDTGAALEKIDSYLASGVSVEQFITNITDYLRSLLLIQNGITKEALLGQKVDRYSQKVRDVWDSIKLERGVSLFLQLYRDIRYSLSPRYELELAISKLCWLSSYVSAREVKFAIDNARSLLEGGTATNNVGINANSSVKIESGVDLRNFTKKEDNINVSTSSSREDSTSTEGGINWRPPIQDTKVRQGGIPKLSALQEENHPFVKRDSHEPVKKEIRKAVAIPAISMEELKVKVIDEMQYTKALLASTLSKSGTWQCSEGTVHIPVEFSFLLKQLGDETNEIERLIELVTGESYKVIIDLNEIETKQERSDLPSSVIAVCEVFNGTVQFVTDLYSVKEEVPDFSNKYQVPFISNSDSDDNSSELLEVDIADTIDPEVEY